MHRVADVIFLSRILFCLPSAALGQEEFGVETEARNKSPIKLSSSDFAWEQVSIHTAAKIATILPMYV